MRLGSFRRRQFYPCHILVRKAKAQPKWSSYGKLLELPINKTLFSQTFFKYCQSQYVPLV